jgi:hypothetical protein
MNLKERLAAELKTNYGIDSISDINEAIARQGKIDISIFCFNHADNAKGDIDGEEKA